MQNLVIVDIGSNSVRMAINRIEDNGYYHEVKRIKNSTRLSEKMGIKKILQPSAMKRTIRALQTFQKYYKNLTNVKIISIATAAVRQAKNKKKFLNLVKQKIGIDINILSGQQEANFDYLGIFNRTQFDNYVVMDIGGASIELVWVKNHQQKHLISIPIGAVNITERFNMYNNISGSKLFKAQNYIYKYLQKIPWLTDISKVPIILLGGTGRSLVRVAYYQNNKSPISSFHQYNLNRWEVFSAYNLLISNNLAKRKCIKGLEKNRADVIVGGLLPLMIILNYFDSMTITFLDGGVREGIINQYIHENY